MSAITIQRRAITWRTVFGVWRRGQTYANLLYLMVAFPLGLTYFILLIVGLSVGLGLAVLGIGLLLLLGTVIGCRLGGSFERDLTVWWLRIPIAPYYLPPHLRRRRTGWQRIQDMLVDTMTWKSLAYLLVKFIFGTIAFSLLTALLAIATVFVATPIAFGLDVILVASGHPAMSGRFTADVLANPGLNAIGPQIVSLLEGLLFFFVLCHVSNGLAWIWGAFAKLMLGRPDAEWRVAQAQAAAVVARAQATQAQAQAVRADQSRRELIVNVSHELRTPIASIRGHVESLRLTSETGQTPEELGNYLGIVERETDRLNGLVDDLLSLARADSGELRLVITAVDPAAVLTEVYQSLAPLARQDREITLVQEISPGLPLVLADRQRLAQVLLNLVRNAIAYTPNGGIVSLSADQPDAATVALIVADTGIGISPEDLPHVFDRFFRADASRSRSSGGFGLGLAIVHDLVGAMGGTVTVTSVVGEGSTFRVVLRRAPADPR